MLPKVTRIASDKNLTVELRHGEDEHFDNKIDYEAKEEGVSKEWESG